MWIRFIPHFGIVDNARFISIEENGNKLELNSNCEFPLVPSHFLHSTGCYSLFDPISKILFTGDIGAAVFDNDQYLFTDDFKTHKPIIDGFHKRYMCSNKVLKKWVSSVRNLNISMIATQHGAVYRGKAVAEFLDYLDNLKCGTDYIEELYR